MAGSSEDQWRRHADKYYDKLEEGEFVPGPAGHHHSESDTEEYYNHYSSSESDDEPTSKACSYSVATHNGGASSSSVAANDGGHASSFSAVAGAAPVLACRICGKEFTSIKAVCGHMKVHALEAQWRQEQGNWKKEKEAKRIAAVERGWGFTGKRGFPLSRLRAVSPNAEPESPTAIVAAETKLVLDPTPLAYAASNPSSVHAAPAKTDVSGEGSGAQSMHDDAMAVVVAGANPPTEAVVHQQAAPLPAGTEAPPPVHQSRAAPPPAAGAQKPHGHTCGECGAWFKTHQALGGHVAGHKSRRLAAAGVDRDGAAPCRRGSKTKKRHVCEKCSIEFPKGVQLGGHMRKHYTGKPIVPQKKPRLDPTDVVESRIDPADVDMADLSLALPVEEADVQSPAPTVEAVQPAPSPAAEGTPEPTTLAPRVTGRVILFGIDIGLGVQKPTVKEDSPATKEDSLA